MVSICRTGKSNTKLSVKGTAEAEEVMSLYERYGRTISYEQAMDEAAADYAGRMLEDGRLLDEFIERHRTDRTLLERFVEAIREIIGKLTGREKEQARTVEQKLSAALDAAAAQAEALGGKESAATAGGEIRYSIHQTADGKKYVKADRQVIFGNDPDSWSQQVEDYINGKIRRGQNVQVMAEDGAILTLTADTAGKIASPYTSRGTTIPEDEYYTKVNAGAHIDELVEVSKQDGIQADKDGRHGDFAADGWQYRTAYFQDFDGKYYRIFISVAQGADGNVVYNIGKIRERVSPTLRN